MIPVSNNLHAGRQRACTVPIHYSTNLPNQDMFSDMNRVWVWANANLTVWVVHGRLHGRAVGFTVAILIIGPVSIQLDLGQSKFRCNEDMIIDPPSSLACIVFIVKLNISASQTSPQY